MRQAALAAAAKRSYLAAPAATIELLARHLCSPSRGEREKATQRELGGARVNMEVLDNREIAVYHWGDCTTQPYILCSHGWDSSACAFQPWSAPLQDKGLALVAVDQPAHGRSEPGVATVIDFACMLFAVASRFGPPAGVLGHSLGGLAAAIAIKEGLPVPRAVLVAPEISAAIALRRRARRMCLGSELRRCLLRHVEAETRTQLEQLDLRSCAANIEIPTLVVCDKADVEVEWKDVASATRDWRHGLLTTVGLGHHRLLTDRSVIQHGVGWLGRK